MKSNNQVLNSPEALELKSAFEKLVAQLQQAGTPKHQAIKMVLDQYLPTEPEDKLETFSVKIANKYCKLFKDTIYTKQVKGNKDLNQTQAMHAMIQLYASTEADIIERPLELVKREEARAIIISRSMKKQKREKELAGDEKGVAGA